jgi:hypothetical protein
LLAFDLAWSLICSKSVGGGNLGIQNKDVCKPQHDTLQRFESRKMKSRTPRFGETILFQNLIDSLNESSRAAPDLYLPSHEEEGGTLQQVSAFTPPRPHFSSDFLLSCSRARTCKSSLIPGCSISPRILLFTLEERRHLHLPT